MNRSVTPPCEHEYWPKLPCPPLTIDLFAGAGGLTQGFRDAGYKIVQAVERDVNAAATYSTNHPEVDLILADIRDLDPRECLQRLGVDPGVVTTVIGGPPCQGFSESNRRTRTLSNPKNHLYRDFLRFVRHIQPKSVVLENVAGLRTMSKGLILDYIIDGLGNMGYRSQHYVLNAANHGVPQVRRRLFIIAHRLNVTAGQVSELDSPPLAPPPTVRAAIADLPPLANGASTDLLEYGTTIQSPYQRQMRRHAPSRLSGNLVSRNAPHIVERYTYIPEGGNWRHIPRHLLANYSDTSRCHTGIYHRLYWDRPSKVIGNFRKNMLIHPAQDRGLSVREAARLQSFPDHYRFSGSIGFQQQQVADAVPPLLAETVARTILRSSRREYRETVENSTPATCEAIRTNLSLPHTVSRPLRHRA